MTVLVLTTTFDGRDGLSCLSRDVTTALARAFPDSAVSVLTLAGERSIPHPTATVRGCGGSRVGLAARAMAAIAARPRALVVLHAHLLPLASPAIALGTPLVPVLVGIEAWRPPGAWRRYALARARALIAISAHTRDRFRAAAPSLATRPVLVCHPSTPSLPEPVADSGLPAAGYALMVGRMAAAERYKGHDVVLDAWPRVTAVVPDARLVIVGGGDDVHRLRRRVEVEGLQGQVTFTGPVDDPTLAALYARAGVFVLPSTDEGFGYVFLEAMSAGRACIAAEGAAEEIIEHGVSGFIVRSRDAAGVAEPLIRLLRDPALAEAMGRAGRARARTDFTIDCLSGCLRQALASVLPC